MTVVMRRKILLSCLAALLIGAAAVISAVLPWFGSYVEAHLVALGNGQNLRLAFKHFNAGTTTVQAEELSVFIPRLLLGLLFRDVQAQISVLPLLKLQPTSSLHASAYEGTLAAQVSYALMDGSMGLAIDLENLHLAAHPQLDALGVTSGTLSISSPAMLLPAGRLPGGPLRVKLNDFMTGEQLVLPGRLFGGAAEVVIPKIEGFNLDGQLDFESAGVNVRADCDLQSVGKFNVNGRLNLSPAFQLTEMDLVVDTQLSPDGIPKFNLLRALLQSSPPLTAEQLAESGAKWRIVMKGPIPPSIKIERKGD